MECYLFCNIGIIVMQMLKFRNTHTKRLKVSLVRRSSAPERGRRGDHADRKVHIRVDLPNMDRGQCWTNHSVEDAN